MRLIAEQFRLPDEHIGYLLGTSWITIGILYTIPMLIAGISIVTWKHSNQ
jgi:phosphatidylglycerol:prolipoprotein diacylglycerol transferase